ncbi:MAG TPA: hypothetical protein VGI81_05445, partial [Tepidisphaeraceae bacterium]
DDRTVVLAIPTRKPHPKSLGRGNEIDGDGVWRWFIEGHEDVHAYRQEVKHLVYATAANKINVKRALREQVEGKLDAVAQEIASLRGQLERMEQKLDALAVK